MLADRPYGMDLAGSEYDCGDLLDQRHQKDRKRYLAMTSKARASYNAHRKELYDLPADEIFTFLFHLKKIAAGRRTSVTGRQT